MELETQLETIDTGVHVLNFNVAINVHTDIVGSLFSATFFTFFGVVIMQANKGVTLLILLHIFVY